MTETRNLPPHLETDLQTVSSIDAVPSILEVICRTTGMGFAAIARVTEDRWIACAVRDEIEFGLLPGGELQVETTICDEIRDSGEAVVIDSVDEDSHFCRHHTPAMYGFKSYISFPIFLKNGEFFGTLCAIDPKPAIVSTAHITGMFKLFAELIAFHLDAAEQLTSAKRKLAEELETSELREQFIAILGHDLRNPVGAISNAADIIRRMETDERVLKFINIIQDSSLRMRGLIDNILDFARGRLGDGITLNRSLNSDLEGSLNQIIAELSVIWPESGIEKKISLDKAVYCDSTRIAQLFSNLLSNAIKHGDRSAPIVVRAICDDSEFTLSVTNAGKKIPESVQAQLFKPFSRSEVKSGEQGLGLGLFIASEIAAVHGGSLQVSSTDDETCFTLKIPAVAT